MLRKPLLSLLLALLLVGAFVYGVTRLFLLRYEVGDIYPEYSSLRSDPLGTKAIADALDALPNVDIQRNFKPLPKLQADKPVTLVYTGVPNYAVWTQPELAKFDSLVVSGSRAVLTFYPVEHEPTEKQEKHAADAERLRKEKKNDQQRAKYRKKNADDKKKADEEKKPADDKTPGDDSKPADSKDGNKDADKQKDDGKTGDKKNGKKASEPREVQEGYVVFDDVAKRWGLSFGYIKPEKKDKNAKTDKKDYQREATLFEPGGHLEPEIAWHTVLCFRNLKPQWKVLYTCNNEPVVIERKYGEGSIILVADAYVISNEALRKDRQPKLLSRIFSGPSPVVFDEDSHDLHDNPGIASLARKYRLHGVVAGLLLLAGLFVWKNGVRFIPAYEPQFADRDVVAGKESGEGFVNLLRRSIAPSAIFNVCVSEWRKAFARNPRDLARFDEAMVQAQAHPPEERGAIRTYKEISRALARKA